MQSTENYSSETLKLDYYFDPSVPSSSAKMYEDDGVSADALSQRKYELLTFSAEFENKELIFKLDRNIAGAYQSMPENRTVELQIHNLLEQPNQVRVGDKLVSIVDTYVGLESNASSAFLQSDR